jgi:hypothetical protein
MFELCCYLQVIPGLVLLIYWEVTSPKVLVGEMEVGKGLSRACVRGVLTLVGEWSKRV